jgi:7-carboxy-7-deazaguanine synthase
LFGHNIPIKPVYEPRDTLNVISVFLTIQGEGPLAGLPAVFIRLAGCNLRCHFCDTEFTEGARERTLDALLGEVEFLTQDTETCMVVLTGGEPLAQPITALVARLVERDFYVQIETAGTVWQRGLERYVVAEQLSIVCSPKTSTVHRMVAEFCKHYKYIIRNGEIDPTDGLPGRCTQDPNKPMRLYRPDLDNEDITVWVQPCDEYSFDGREHDFPRIKDNAGACVKIAQRFGYRISFQLHKVLGIE